jgi:glycosyltransferase involved in cell wall biosynthesis
VRLLWVQDAFWPDLRGGAERRAYHLVQALAARGHQVDVLTRRTVPVGARHNRLGGAAVYRANTAAVDARLWRIRPSLWMKQWRDIYSRFLNGQPYDGAIVFQPEAAHYLRRFRQHLPILIATGGTWAGAKPHEFAAETSSLSLRFAKELAFWQYYYYERLGNRAADYVVAESRNVREQLMRLYHLPPRRVPVIGNGVDHGLFRPRPAQRTSLRRRLGCPGSAFVVIGVGRLARVKNFSYLLRATAIAVAESLDLCTIIVGDGSRRPMLEQLARQLRIAERVKFLGHRSDVPELLAAADVFILPSVFEAYGSAWVEAMASGLPCMGLRYEFGRVFSAAGEHIEHGKTGFLLDPDDPGDCAARIRELADQPSLRTRMGEAACRVATATYSWDVAAERYEQWLLTARASRV